MRVALQKLLRKPSALNVLRQIVQTPGLELSQLSPTCSTCLRRKFYQNRRYTSITIEDHEVQSLEEDSPQNLLPQVSPLPIDTPSTIVDKIQLVKQRSYNRLQGDYGPWDESQWTEERIEFESNLKDSRILGKRLLDQPDHCEDIRLWACLFDYRQRRYGSEGVSMFWKAIYHRKLPLPTDGIMARKFWMAFVDHGLSDVRMLEDLLRYSNGLLSSTGRRWNRLYTSIMQHLLCSGRGQEVNVWHKRLVKLHPPPDTPFIDMCRHVILRNGDLKALGKLYEMNANRKAYSKVMKTFCAQEMFDIAYEWHWIFFRNKDYPPDLDVIKPLLEFLATFNPPRFENIKESFAEAGISLSDDTSLSTEDDIKTPNKSVHLYYGLNLQQPVTKYNDKLGARWCATSWIPLETTINAMHALGVQAIGPLSLQAIALRDSDCANVTNRIIQLSDLGISIGSSVFSRAVNKFAEVGQQENLDNLLKSDQHPDALEDKDLQEQLLAHFSRVKDWPQYRKTLGVLLLDSVSPKVATLNLMLKCHIFNCDTPAIMSTLFRMQDSRISINPRTISYLTKETLRLRQTGRRTASIRRQDVDDLSLIISILQSIMRSGSVVPIVCWKEILRRLGMLDRLEELESLVSFLVSSYNPVHKTAMLGNEAISTNSWGKYQLPKDLSTSTRMHPFHLLISAPLQKAIVEWGFIRAFQALQGTRSKCCSSISFTYGITILRRLHHLGVKMDSAAIRAAIFNRLVIYYGPERYKSNKTYNRSARRSNMLSLEEMVEKIDEAMGEPVFAGVNVRMAVYMNGLWRIGRNRLVKKSRDTNELLRKQIGGQNTSS